MTHARTLWEEGHEPGRQIVALGFACALTAVVLDLILGSGLGLLFDLCFVALCAGLALAVRSSDFFVVGVLPPLLMVVVFGLVGAVAPESVAYAEAGVIQSIVSGLAHHSGALIVGYALCLGILAIRHRVLAARASGDAAPAISR